MIALVVPILSNRTFDFGIVWFVRREEKRKGRLGRVLVDIYLNGFELPVISNDMVKRLLLPNRTGTTIRAVQRVSRK